MELTQKLVDAFEIGRFGELALFVSFDKALVKAVDHIEEAVRKAVLLFVIILALFYAHEKIMLFLAAGDYLAPEKDILRHKVEPYKMHGVLVKVINVFLVIAVSEVLVEFLDAGVYLVAYTAEIVSRYHIEVYLEA